MTFEEAGLDLQDVLKVVIIGGNVIGRKRGAKKLRRRVPRKQETLVQLVAGVGRAGFDELAASFPKEWARIQSNKEGEYVLVAKRELFRNIADLAGRVNEALLICYEDPTAGRQALAYTGGARFGLSFDHQELSVSWFLEDELQRYRERIQTTEVGGHVSFTQSLNRSSSHEVPVAVQDSANDGEIVDAEIVEEDGGSLGGQGEVPPVAVPAPANRDESHEVLVAREKFEPESDAVIAEFEVDRVTGLWGFMLDGHDIEVESRHGHLKIDGRMYSSELLEGLEEPEQIEGAALHFIRRCIRLVEEEVTVGL